MVSDPLEVAGVESVVLPVLVVRNKLMVTDRLPQPLRVDPKLVRERSCGL
jgi:hypothetical protein